MLFFTFIIAILDATLIILYDCNRNDFALGLPDCHRYTADRFTEFVPIYFTLNPSPNRKP